MSVNSRRKGAEFERLVARMIYDELGVVVKRNLAQYQEKDLGDLVGLDGWTLEMKIRRSGYWMEDAWWDQVVAAAMAAKNKPALIFKFQRQPIRVAVPAHLMPELEQMWEPIVMSFPAWCQLVRERM